ncbi:MAG TPA: tRNA 2-thiouridine(34) synthase MnmA [Acholeplasmataceae bacterium]|jgi:tRNA-specific 2-thiouridylase|nr:tRNA 2-thiouridine(34) synthase MnmA [Acholeplasmataceae bacterium]
MSKKKVIVGLSGGVDSAVSVIRLLEAGYDVEGLFMRNWDSSLNNDIKGNPHVYDPVCPQENDYLDALETAKILGINLHRVDFVQEYWDKVFTYFLNEYRNNRTPNPDILCNKEIKFKCFLEKAFEMGADYIAMGHYARIRHEPEVQLLRGVDSSKDQSYFLCQLTKEQLSKSLFPIGDMYKREVRELAEKYNLNVARKKDSTGVCFIGERNFKEFLKNYLPAQPGNMETIQGEVVGKHEGIMYYTIGQRHGLGIGGAGEPWFVIGKDVKRNVLLVGRGSEQEMLFSNRAIITNINWLGKEFVEKECTVKFRYRSKDISAQIKRINQDSIEVRYPGRAKAVTPGQAAVFYDGEVLLGGGTIDKVYLNNELRPY